MEYINRRRRKSIFFCESIIDAQCFNSSTSNKTVGGTTIYANNWQYSSIRTWLNNTFYKTAFDKLSQSIIQSTYLDNANSASLSENEKTEKYVKSQNSTYDNVFLLSRNDLYSSNYGFSNDPTDSARWRYASDYVRSIGLSVSKGSNVQEAGVGSWWTRSPSYGSYGGTYDRMVGQIAANGQIASGKSCDATNGIVPALWIKL